MSITPIKCVAALVAVLSVASAGGALAQSQPAADPLTILPDSRQIRADAERARTPETLFAVFDANTDGCIDAAEWRRRIMAVFFVLDTEGTDPITKRAGDGQLTRAEAPNIREDLFHAADLNADGKLSAFEFNQAGFTSFDKVTKRQPDCITLAEFSAYLQSLRTDLF